MAKSRRANKQIKESDPKMGFVGRPNKALANLEFKRPIWSQIGENRMGEREKGRRRERREEEEGGFKPRSSQKVWKLTLFMNPMRLCMNFHALMVILLPKSRVFVRVSY